VSATGRGASSGYERHPDDFYATPYWATRALLPMLYVAEDAAVLDPFAGEGAILDVFTPRRTLGIEIDVGRAVRPWPHGVTCADALTPSLPWPRADLIVTNPPYSIAMEAILRALSHAAECRAGGIDVAFLLRLNFLGAQKRADFHRRYPADIGVLPRRPSFVCSLSCERKPACKWTRTIAYAPSGELREPKPPKCQLCSAATVSSSSDATEYAWFVWGPGRGGRWRVLDVGASE
jgi:hypothetical protein